LTYLSPDHREIIDLVYYHEKSVEDAAQRVVSLSERMHVSTVIDRAKHSSPSVIVLPAGLLLGKREIALVISLRVVRTLRGWPRRA
jgi:hypothetical protein